jgi:hypothetical protein
MTEKELTELLLTAKSLALEGWEVLLDTDTALAECNGLGPGWLRITRKVISFLFPVFAPPAAIHDMVYFRGGSWQDRERADRAFLANSIISIEAKYQSAVMRKFLTAIAKGNYYLLRLGGHFSFNYKKEISRDNV